MPRLSALRAVTQAIDVTIATSASAPGASTAQSACRPGSGSTFAPTPIGNSGDARYAPTAADSGRNDGRQHRTADGGQQAISRAGHAERTQHVEVGHRRRGVAARSPGRR